MRDLLNFCILHPDLPAVAHMTVPCAPGGKVGMCTTCNNRFLAKDRTFITDSFNAYQASHEHAQRIAQRKQQN